MGAIPLKVRKREIGKQVSKQIRKEGLVPGVFYFHGQEAIAIATDTMSLRPIVYTSATRIIDLQIEGEDAARECVLRDIQLDPVTDKLVHFDLQGIKEGEKLHVEVPVILTGASEGARIGGIVSHIVRKIGIKCLPSDLPEALELDITPLKIGDSMKVSDIKYEGIEFMIPENTPVVAIIAPRVSGDDEATVEGEEGAEEGAEEAASEE